MALLIKKEITGQALLNAGACKLELERFVRRYGLFTPITDADVTSIEQHETLWVAWLINQDFLSKDVVFKPIIFTIPDKEMAAYIWHRLNCSATSTFRQYETNILREENGRGDLPPVPVSRGLTDRVWKAFNSVFDPRKLV